MNNSKFFIVLSILSVSFLLTGCCWQKCPDGRETGLQASFVLDGNNYPHIAYTYSSAKIHGIKYASWNGNSWQRDRVVEYSGDNNWRYHCRCGIGITLDTNNNPYIAFINPDRMGSINIAHLIGGKWEINTIGNLNSDFTMISQLFIDDNNELHFAYITQNYTTTTIYYAVGNGFNWSVTTVGQSAVGPFVGLVMDKSDLPHICTGNQYMYYNGLSWFTDTVIPSGANSGCSDLSINALNEPYIPYILSGNIYLTYMTNGEWITMPVAMEDQITGCSNNSEFYASPLNKTLLVLSSTGKPIVISNTYVFEWNGNSWEKSCANNVSGILQLAKLDNNDRLHLLYTQVNGKKCCETSILNFVLTYAFWDGSKWVTQTVD